MQQPGSDIRPYDRLIGAALDGDRWLFARQDTVEAALVIVGGRFAGLFAVRMLARAPVQVTLVDRAEHHLFQPLLYQCSTGILSEGKIAAPLRQLLSKHSNVEFVIAEVSGIDAAGRRVLARRPLGEQVE